MFPFFFFFWKSISILPTNPRTAKICHSRSFLMSAVLLRAVRHRAFVDQIEGVQRHPFHWSPLIHDDLVPKSLTGWASENLVLGIFSIELEGLHYGHVLPRLRPGSIRLPVIQGPPGGSTTSCDAAALWPLILHDPTSYDHIALEGLSLSSTGTPSSRCYHKQVFLLFFTEFSNQLLNGADSYFLTLVNLVDAR